MPRKPTTTSINRRLISKNISPPPIEEPERVELKSEDYRVNEPKPDARVFVQPTQSLRWANVDELIPVYISGLSTRHEIFRTGVLNHYVEGGSLLHCLLKAIYPPYTDWDKARKIRKVREFRQDLAENFQAFFMRLDQKQDSWGSLSKCKRDLMEEADIPYRYFEYFCKILNKNIILTELTETGLKLYPGTKIYGHDSSPRDDKTYIILVKSDRGTYEVVMMDKKYSLFPEQHSLLRILKSSD